jgi:hypothetical protein
MRKCEDGSYIIGYKGVDWIYLAQNRVRDGLL